MLNQTVNNIGRIDVQITPQSVTIDGLLPDYDPGGGSLATGERVACGNRSTSTPS